MHIEVRQTDPGIWAAVHASNGAILGTGKNPDKAVASAVRQVIRAAMRTEHHSEVLTVLLDEVYK